MGTKKADGNARGGALPPQNLEAESAVLGGFLVDPDSVDAIQPILAPDHFYAEHHRLTCQAIYSMRERGIPVDAVALGRELEARGHFSDFGGVPYIQGLMEAVPHASHSVYYAGLVKDAWKRRTIIDQCAKTLREAYSGSLDTADVVARHDSATQRLLETTLSSAEVKPVTEILYDLFDRRAEEEQDGPRHVVVETGFRVLDQITLGMRGTHVIVLAARASMGKTALAMDIIRRCTKRGDPAIFFSLEMGGLELVERMLAAESGVSGYKIRKNELDEIDQQKLMEAAERLHTLPLMIDDRSEVTCAQIGAVIRRMKRSHGIKLAVVDYLQLIESESGAQTREQEVSQISRRMKKLAKALEIPIVLIAQLSREVEKRQNNRPRLSDLRESGAIEQDADQVWFVHRPEYYDPEDRPGEAEIIVAKNRSGPVTTPNQQIWLHWVASTMSFREPESTDPGLIQQVLNTNDDW